MKVKQLNLFIKENLEWPYLYALQIVVMEENTQLKLGNNTVWNVLMKYQTETITADMGVKRMAPELV